MDDLRDSVKLKITVANDMQMLLNQSKQQVAEYKEQCQETQAKREGLLN